MSCYAVQCLSERTRLAVTDSVDNTSLLLYMKLKNSCKYTAIGAASQHLPWKRSKQKCNCLQSPHSILLLPPQKDEIFAFFWKSPEVVLCPVCFRALLLFYHIATIKQQLLFRNNLQNLLLPSWLGLISARSRGRKLTDHSHTRKYIS